MRTNLPVTQREYALPPGRTLVSVTDLQGRITYCNPAFVEVSGFSMSELIGQPHNIVRHPDMPAEAFRDLWATIEAGLPWTALVKNRRKNGDHYWVRANATPMKDGERITGFLSVRSVPSREEMAAAEALYARLRDGAPLALQRGQVHRTDIAGRLARMLRPGPQGLLALGLGLACALPAVAVALAGPWGWFALAPAAALGVVMVDALLRRPLQPVLRDAYRLAAGDLAHPVHVGRSGIAGELQQALAQLSMNLRTVIADTREQMEGVRGAAHEIAAGNQDLSARTESQASSLEQTAASMEQINATVRQSAEAAVAGASQAGRTAEVTRHGNEAVQAVAGTMRSIDESSRRIGEIIATVDGVAFQTNILALNAAVEAARAGDAGRGFAVVASEVRALAQRSAGAAREIKALIDESAGRVAEGGKRVEQARTRMGSVLSEVTQVSETLEDIRRSAQEQQTGIAQINEAVAQMDTITQSNAAMVEQLAASAQSLNGLVEEVSRSLGMFRLAPGEATIAERDAVQLRREARAALAA